MLPKERKLDRKTFPHFSLKKNFWDGGVLRFQYSPLKNSAAIHRFSVVVAKKRYPTVVSRNLFKRRVLSVIQKHINDFDRVHHPAHSYIIYPKQNVSEIDLKHITQDIKGFLDIFSL